MNALEKLADATRMLAEVRSARDAKKLANMAAAAEYYARKAKLGEEAIAYAHTIKIDAMELMGGYLAKEVSPGKRPADIIPGGNNKNLPEGVTAKESSAAQFLHTVAGKARELFEAVRNGKKSITAARLEVRRTERIEKAREISAIPNLTRCTLLHSDIADIAVEPETVDAIITDPPYPKEFVPVFHTLADVAARVLKPGGSLLVMTGQSYLPEVVAALSDRLNYQWTIAYLTPGGQAAQLWQRKVNTFWKPVLWFVKGTYSGEWVGDVVKSATNDNDKRFHDWGQSESGMAQLVERWSLPGDTILDPFLGGGTTGLVALKLGRRFIGVDKDADSIAIARARLAE